jgi:hypothetical protein
MSDPKVFVLCVALVGMIGLFFWLLHREWGRRDR